MRDHAIAAVAELLGFAGDLRHVEHQFLLAAIARDADARVGGGIERGEDFLGAILVIQRRAIDGRDQVAGAQSDARERLAIGARVDTEAAHLAAGEHRLRPHNLADDTRIVAHQPAHAFERGVVVRAPQRVEAGAARLPCVPAVRRGSSTDFERAIAIDDGPVVVDRMQRRAAGHLLPDRDDLGRRGAFSNDRHAFLGIGGGQHARPAPGACWREAHWRHRRWRSARQHCRTGGR